MHDNCLAQLLEGLACVDTKLVSVTLGLDHENGFFILETTREAWWDEDLLNGVDHAIGGLDINIFKVNVIIQFVRPTEEEVALSGDSDWLVLKGVDRSSAKIPRSNFTAHNMVQEDLPQSVG